MAKFITSIGLTIAILGALVSIYLLISYFIAWVGFDLALASVTIGLGIFCIWMFSYSQIKKWSEHE